MKEGLYEIVSMRRANRGKWVFTARPLCGEIQFVCETNSMEQDLFKYARGVLWLRLKENREGTTLDCFETVEERRATEELTRRESEDANR